MASLKPELNRTVASRGKSGVQRRESMKKPKRSKRKMIPLENARFLAETLRALLVAEKGLIPWQLAREVLSAFDVVYNHNQEKK